MKQFSRLSLLLSLTTISIVAQEPITINLQLTIPSEIAAILKSASSDEALSIVGNLISLSHAQPKKDHLIYAFVSYLNDLQNKLSCLTEEPANNPQQELHEIIRNIELFMDQAGEYASETPSTRGISMESINREKINALAEKMNSILQKMASVEILLGQSIENSNFKSADGITNIESANLGIIDWLKVIYHEIKKITGDDTL